MEWPLISPAVPDEQTPLWKSYYLASTGRFADPTILWGTEIDMTGVTEFLRRENQESPVLLTPMHVLLRSVACALQRHPIFNRRVLWRRLYDFKSIGLIVPLQKVGQGEADVVLLEKMEQKSLLDVARELWQHNQDAARREQETDGSPPVHRRIPMWITRRFLMRVHLFLANNVNLPVRASNRRQRLASVAVNYLGFRGAPPMRSFKPSRFPNDCCPSNVTLGATEQRPTVVDGQVVVRPIAPLFVRADHRLADAYEIARFVGTIRELLADPSRLEASSPAGPADDQKAPESPTMSTAERGR